MITYYVHHAYRDYDSSENKNEHGITKDGVSETEIFGKQLSSYAAKVSAIYTSSYNRCRLTAEILNKYVNSKIVEEPLFNEWQRGTEWEDFLNNNIKALKKLEKNHAENDVVIVVTSGVNLNAFISHFYKIPAAELKGFVQAMALSPIKFDIRRR